MNPTPFNQLHRNKKKRRQNQIPADVTVVSIALISEDSIAWPCLVLPLQPAWRDKTIAIGDAVKPINCHTRAVSLSNAQWKYPLFCWNRYCKNFSVTSYGQFSFQIFLSLFSFLHIPNTFSGWPADKSASDWPFIRWPVHLLVGDLEGPAGKGGK